MRDIITVCLLLVPMVSHWILPDGIERRLYFDIAGLPLYSFDICYIIYITRYKRLSIEKKSKTPQNILQTLSITFFLFFIYAMYVSILNNRDSTFTKLLCDNWFFGAAFIFLRYPLSKEMLQGSRWIIIPSAIIISFEVILYATGVLSYSEELGDQEFGGISRISTTIGAATGTAVILYMLGGIILSLYTDLKSEMKWGIILLITVAIFFTISRGSIISWGIFLAIFIYKNYLRNSRFTTKLYAIMISFLALTVLNRYNVFNPVLERQEELVAQDLVDTNRDYKVQKTLRYFRDSGYLGVGLGEMKVEKGLERKVNVSCATGVHSFYYNTLGETGIVGLLLVMIFLIRMVTMFDFKDDITYLSFIILALTFTTEPVFVLAEFTAIAFFIFSIAINKESHISHPIQNAFAICINHLNVLIRRFH